jgi:acyl carrier protein
MAVIDPAATVTETAPTPTTGVDPVTAKVLEIVSGQTGYPPDMLDLDLDLEADLGVDTVKQAETFAAIRDEYGIERDDNLALRDYPTLEHVIGFVRDRRPDLAPTPSPASPAEPMAVIDPAATATMRLPPRCPGGSRRPFSARTSSCACRRG